MKTLTYFFTIALITMLVSQLLSCGVIKNEVDKLSLKKVVGSAHPEIDTLARRAGQNLALGASEKAQLITQNLIGGLKGSMDTLNPDVQKLIKTLDSIGNLSEAKLIQLGKTLNIQLNSIKGNVQDEKLKKFLINLVSELTGKLNHNTEHLLSNMIQKGLDSLAAPSSEAKIALFMNHLLGQNTQKNMQLLVSKALQPSIDSLQKSIDKLVYKDLPFVQKQATELLVTLGVIACGIIGFVWYQKQKYAKLVKILTYQIDKIPSQTEYDNLTTQIKSKTQQADLEPLLRNILQEQGINT
jgi:hypothetical protein